MAYSISYVFTCLAIILPVAICGTDFMVGDDEGWTINFDYSVWAKGKDFTVGDRLVFMYPVGAHNVFKVNGTSFQSCTKPPLSEALTSGKDVIELTTPGRKWYICGVASHCAIGQKLFINVNPSPPASAPFGSDPFFPIAPIASPPQAMPFDPPFVSNPIYYAPFITPSEAMPYTSSSYAITTSAFGAMMVILIACFSIFGV